EFQANDRPRCEVGGRSCDGRCTRRYQSRKRTKERTRLIGCINWNGRSMPRLPFPACAGFVVPEAHSEVLHQAVKRHGALRAKRASGGNFLRRKNLKEEAKVGPITGWRGPEVSRGPDRDRELREYVTATRNRERLAGEGALAGQQRRDRLTYS